jgi:hypothetical protein
MINMSFFFFLKKENKMIFTINKEYMNKLIKHFQQTQVNSFEKK